jgi:hypothetical protein
MDFVQFEAYSYRVGARFGGHIWIEVDEDKVNISGPRVASPVYSLWIVVQVIVFWSSIPAIVAAVIFKDWRYLLLALGIIFVHWVISSMGAGCLWELENMMGFFASSRGKTVIISRRAVKRVKIGRGWARNGLWLAIPIYVPLINALAKDSVVSFESPDREMGKDVVFAFHLRTKEEASNLATLLATGN